MGLRSGLNAASSTAKPSNQPQSYLTRKSPPQTVATGLEALGCPKCPAAAAVSSPPQPSDDVPWRSIPHLASDLCCQACAQLLDHESPSTKLPLRRFCPHINGSGRQEPFSRGLSRALASCRHGGLEQSWPSLRASP